ncbi:nucleotidyltransferase family protein [Thalassorhabdomicrobium marinisediminis]|uniref:Nucleotidyltransferase n=1 Tax=Thalassorhabdomicrobium marinisediminis TaxID=2170577 RepID=A0A2T7FZQ1_9RHOB|nr:nucleotidyltransferase family protein [Thalassorhabdomicrobium marinisediminis]PVA07643.1 nucleotidyltransferase [Thalassorhabdomicrobium marinisediminis]
MTHTPNAVLLFAAGLGTRMAPLTDTRPKPLVQVAGRPLLDHALALCDGLKTVVNCHYLAGQIKAHLAGTETQVSDESDLLRETGGGLKHALPLLGPAPVFTLNTDAVWHGPNPVEALRTTWRPEMEALLLMIPREAAVGHGGGGDFDINATGRLHRGSEYVYSGLQIIRTNRLAAVPEDVFSMWRLWSGMLERGTMYGTAYGGRWCDVGRPDSIPLAEAMLNGTADV